MSAEQPKLRVMVVDDHPMWRDGSPVTWRTRGSRWWRRPTAWPPVPGGPGGAPDVVLMDMQLPGRQRCAGHGRGAHGVTSHAGPRAVGVRRTRGRTRRRQGRGQRISGEVGVEGRTCRGGTGDRRRAGGVHPGLAGLVLGEYRRMSREPESRPNPRSPNARPRCCGMWPKV